MDTSLHLSDDQLELYALDRLAETDEDRIEDHLLLCDPCRNRLDDIGLLAFRVREALRQNPPYLDREEPRFPWSLFVWRSWMMPSLALAGTAAVLLTMLVLRHDNRNRDLAPLATVTLTAMRGNGGETGSVAKPSREYDLVLADAGTAATLVRVFNAGGTEIWKGAPAPAATGKVAKVVADLPEGLYIARLEDSAGGTLHEYAFQVRK